MKNLKIGIIIFAIAVICIIFAPNVYATDINDITDMSSVLTGATVNENIITLNQNVNLGSNYLKILSGTYVIDLKGFALSGNNNIIIQLENGTLTINDSSVAKSGSVINTKNDGNTSYQAAITAENGSIIFNGGTINGEEYGVYASNTVTVNNGTFLGEIGFNAVSLSNITIYNGFFGTDDSEYGLRIYGTGTINGGTYKGKTGFLSGDDSSVTISNGTFGNSLSKYGARIFEDAIINNGRFNGWSDGLLFMGNDFSDILTIENGTFGSSNTESGMRIDGGMVTINSGIFNGGNNGCGIVADIADGNAVKLTINNATATSTDGYGMYISSDSRSDNYEINIKGGTYTGSYSGVFVYDLVIPYVKLSGGRYIVTTATVSDNYGGVHIWSRTADNSEHNTYTLNSLLKEGYNYSNTAFVEKLDTSDNEYYFTTASNVFVAQEKTVTVKEGITNGTVIAKAKAVVGEEVTLTIISNSGYRLKSISALDKFNKMPVTVTNSKFIMPNYNIFIGAEFELIPVDTLYNITVRSLTNGTVTGSKNTAKAGEEITLTVTPNDGYKLKEGTLKINNGAVTITNNKFVMPSENVTITSEFELVNEEKIITKTKEGLTIWLKGVFNQTPELIITKIEKGNNDYDSLITLVKEDKVVLGSYDVSITGGSYTGELEITFTVGKQFEEDKITIYHKLANGEIETKTAVVKDEKVAITVTELSPFMLVEDKEVVAKKDETPKTGNNDYIGGITLIIGLSIVGTTKIKKNKI